MTARRIAARVLVRVWERASFAAPALDAELRRAAGLDPRDAALATELVYGVLRTESALEESVLAAARKHSVRLAAEARAYLYIGVYALVFLDRVPAFAAVSEAVAGVASVDQHAAGFANAVLRRIAETPSERRPSLADAVSASVPGWLRGALRKALGRAGARAFLEAGPVPPPIGLCLAAGEDRAAWVERLRAFAPAASIEPGTVSPRAISVRGAGDVRLLPGAGSAWIIQEEGSQVVALALGARAGERVLDACAGHGNKSWAVGDDVGPAGVVDAADIAAAKLDELRQVARGLRRTFTVDWTEGTGDVPDGYHRALVDAPCTGVGTLRRRPEIARRREEADVPRLAALQIEIGRRVATRVRDGGRLVYSVCSVLRDEAEDVVMALAEPAGGVRLEPAPFDAEPARALSGGAATLRLLPHVHGTDGYFVASFVVRHSPAAGD